MKKLILLFAVSALIHHSGCAQTKDKAATSDRPVGALCDGCDQMYEDMPANLSWETRIGPKNEPGEPLVIRGTIYKPDGKTPAPDVILYVYHTDNKGNYTPSPGQTAGKRHGHLRGWMKTDALGRYQFTTIRPAAYPSRKAPQHIHVIVKEKGLSLYWIDEYLFDDDELLTKENRAAAENRGGVGIIHLEKNEKSEWVGQRNIILGLNIPNY